MTNPFNNIKNDPAFSLTENERALMRARLLEIARAPRPAVSVFTFIFHMRVAALALILIVSTTSVSFAAGGALPGEVLYGVKLGVNERIEFALAPSHEAKATVAVRHAEERIREAEVLAAEGKLDEDEAVAAAKLVEENVQKASENTLALLDEGETSAAKSIHARLDATLSAHTELLDAQAENLDEDSANRVRMLSFAVTQTAQQANERDAEDAGIEETDDEQVRAYARATYNRAESRIKELGKRIEENGIALETASELEGEHARLSGEFSVNQELFAEDDEVNATEAYSALERRAVRALTFLKAAQDISDETDKEAVITFGHDTESIPVAAASANEVSALMSTMLAVEEATTTGEDTAAVSDESKESAKEMTVPAPSSKLRFWLRDRSH